MQCLDGVHEELPFADWTILLLKPLLFVNSSQEITILVPKENISVEKRKFKLSKLELRKFSGEPIDFLAFWSPFERIHLDSAIAEDDTFQYLLQCIVPDFKAARLVSSSPPTKGNYSKASTQLKERFGRDELLVHIYVRDLLSIVMKNAAGRMKVDLCRSCTIYWKANLWLLIVLAA
ncbi:putative RNA-directed DNA polymerase from transposon X-element [Trichonephila clavipes]|nr:putative RNA-directed DNA polymerase from transposon X-element [Trichonephila clavipes]